MPKAAIRIIQYFAGAVGSGGNEISPNRKQDKFWGPGEINGGIWRGKWERVGVKKMIFFIF
jgi:hypothetical protein